MAKRKKKKKKKNQKRGSGGRASQARSSSGGRSLEKQMTQVRDLFEAEAYQEAFELLLTMKQKYPRHPIVLRTLADVAIELKNWRAVAIYSEQLYPMERGNERATTLTNLMNAYMKLMLPALAWKTASMLVADHPKFYLIQRAEHLAEGIKPLLFESFGQVELLSERFGDDQDAMLDFMVEHDQMRFLAESNQDKQAILRCQALLTKLPGFIPALNNMSMAYFNVGHLDKAIEATQEVLAQEPDNHHALANLTRYSLLMGQTDMALTYANQLKELEHDRPQRWAKQAEALAYLGDDEGVRDAYLQAKPDDFLDSPILLHLGAAAHYRLGDEAKAWELWQEALRVKPSFSVAKMNLAERRKAPHERDAGWYWPFSYWVTGDFLDSLQEYLSKSRRKGSAKKLILKLLKQYPQLPALAPHLLDRADPSARDTMLSLIELEPRADLLQALLPFGSSKAGTDAQRMKALQFLSEHHGHMLPPDRRVKVWIKGEQQEIVMLAFQISREPEDTILDDQTYDLYQRANEYLKNKQDLERAEELFMEVIKKYPDFPSVYNQLSVIYELQGRHGESITVVKQNHQRFPNYAFARIAVARLALQEQQIERARALLNPLLQQKKLHTSEFRALAQAEILYALALKRKGVARTWLTLWEQVEAEHPDIPRWKAGIER